MVRNRTTDRLGAEQALIALRLATNDYARLERAAKADQRQVGPMARKIVLEWLDQNPDPKETT